MATPEKCDICHNPFVPGRRFCVNCGAARLKSTPTWEKEISKTGVILSIVGALAAYVIMLIITITVIMPAVRYVNAKILLGIGSYSEAYELFTSLGVYMDAEDQANECKKYIDYDEAVFLYNSEEYLKAYTIFKSLDSFKDSAEMTEKCIQPSPDAGVYWKGPRYAESNNDTGLRFENHRDVNMVAAIVISQRVDIEFWGAVYIPAHSQIDFISVSPGSYYFVTWEGYEWFGARDRFGPHGSAPGMWVSQHAPFVLNNGDVTTFTFTPEDYND